MFYEHSISFIYKYKTYIRKNKLQQPFNDRQVMSKIGIVEFGGKFRPMLDRSISYPNPKLTCYAKIQCRLQEVWPLEGHSVKNSFFFFGIIFF